MEENKALVVFQDAKIRRIWHNNEWYFSVVDVVSALTGSSDPNDYWYRLKQREQESSQVELSTLCRSLKLTAEDGKLRLTDCASTKNMFRIIQSIPSQKAEPFKKWLAQVGYDRVQEIENPELAQKRMKEIYKTKGYSEDWIEKRVRGIAVRDELTDEWTKRGVRTDKEYSILTAEISKATFGLTPSEYKCLKGLQNQNLRDHMTDLELIFSMLGERVTAEITRSKNAKEFDECSIAAKQGGEVAGNARKDAEKRIGKKIITGENYLTSSEKNKKKRLS